VRSTVERNLYILLECTIQGSLLPPAEQRIACPVYFCLSSRRSARLLVCCNLWLSHFGTGRVCPKLRALSIQTEKKVSKVARSFGTFNFTYQIWKFIGYFRADLGSFRKMLSPISVTTPIFCHRRWTLLGG